MKDTVQDGARKGLSVIGTGIKEIWSRLDAASEKKRPGEYLSQNAVRAIQGIVGPAQPGREDGKNE